MAVWPWVIAGIVVAVYLLLRFNRLWVRWVDRAWRNRRDALPVEYERPRYVARDAAGQPDMASRWPGWDGWYFFVMPRDRALPVKMIRGSLMTGLYGLEGIDNFEKLQWRLSTSHAVEYLSLIPLDVRNRRAIRFSQQYLPRRTDLRLRTDALQVAVGRNISAEPAQPAGRGAPRRRGADRPAAAMPATYPQGVIEGEWPHYRLRLADPETGARLDLSYTGESVLWWADLPKLFTYFAALGTFEGWLRWERPHRPGEADPEPVRISGRGSFEHGFARTLLDFEPLYLPVRLLRRLVPGLRPIRYHYELFLNDDETLQGGFMKADGFGIAFRNHGGVFQGAAYTALSGIHVDYDPEHAERVSAHCGGGDVAFYRRWRVRAGIGGAPLQYTGWREGPAAHIADGMIFYDFAYEGTFNGKEIRGRGYGEYVHL